MLHSLYLIFNHLLELLIRLYGEKIVTQIQILQFIIAGANQIMIRLSYLKEEKNLFFGELKQFLISKWFDVWGSRTAFLNFIALRPNEFVGTGTTTQILYNCYIWQSNKIELIIIINLFKSNYLDKTNCFKIAKKKI